jgi:DNA-binding NtrC family response regulator
MSFDRRARVLIADADAVVRRKLSKCLLDSEVFADCVADGKLALEALDTSNYAVVVLDLALPPGNAERILGVVGAMPVASRPVVLVLAGRGAARSLDVEVVQIVLRKPCDLTQLSQIVESCVRSTDVRRSEPDVPPARPRQQPIV